MGDEQSLTIVIPLDGEFGTDEERQWVLPLGDRLSEVLVARGLGSFDGDGFGAGEAELFFYGPDANAMLDALGVELSAQSLPNGTTRHAETSAGYRVPFI